jgi:hypothetical protein
MRSLASRFAGKLSSIVSGVRRYFASQKVEVADEVVAKLGLAYMLIVQMNWYRIENDTKVDTFIRKNDAFVQDVLTLLEKYDFEAIVQTYRGIYTNLYTAKGGKRHYSLNSDSLKAFLKDVKDDKVKITAHKTIRQPKVVKPTQSTSFITQFALASGGKVVAEPQPMVAIVKPKVKVAGYFSKVDASNYKDIKEQTFCRVEVKLDEKVYHGRWEKLVSQKYDFCIITKNGNRVMFKKEANAIVETWTRAVR